MGNITSRLPWKRTIQEDIDLWRVYQLLDYREKCGGKEIKVEKIKKRVPVKMQEKMVNSKLTQQIEELLLEKDDDFQLSVNSPQSKDPFPIPGVRLLGHALPGSIVCFYPGLVYRSSHVPLMSNYPNISFENPYLMATTNGCIIDAKAYNYEVKSVSSLYAVGHLVRHPPTDVLANIVPYTLSFTPDPVTSLIPNQYYIINPLAPRIDNGRLVTIVFIAMRHIKNEELFLNYRLHPDSNRPSWYNPLDDEEDKRRWKQTKLFSQ